MLQTQRRGLWLQCGPYRLNLSRRPHLMGIINLTPDSFCHDGIYGRPDAAYRRACELAEAGADMLDVGAESTRPGSGSVPPAEELRRLLPALSRITRLNLPVSVDTSKPEVAVAALDRGACVINDITGLANPAMRALAAERRVPVVIMHMQGTPRSMQLAPRYRNVTREVRHALLTAARRAEAAGVKRNRIILDPGLGFGKTARHNLQLLQELRSLAKLGYPLLVGPSRKRFISAVLGNLPPAERIWGTAAAVALAVAAGAHLLRVHDVAQMRQVALVAAAVARGRLLPGLTGGRP